MSRFRDDLPDSLDSDAEPGVWVLGPFATVAIFWIAGTAAAQHWPAASAWLAAAVLPCVVAIVMLALRRHRALRYWSLIALCPVAAAWSSARQQHVAPQHVSVHVGQEPKLMKVAGAVEGRPRLRRAQGGMFSDLHWAPPTTSFVLRVESVMVNDVPRRSGGRLFVKIRAADTRLRDGDRIRAAGWLSRIEGPANPGERDFRVAFARRGIDGRFTMASSDNWQLVQRAGAISLQRARRAISDSVAQSLRLGMGGATKKQQQRAALLDAILLGRRDEQLNALSEAFRRVGLAHLLSISGAHLAILLGLVWFACRLFVHQPPRAALMVLVVLALYLIAVPWRVPIVRAALMAALMALGYWSGRRVRSLELMALAAVLVLIWRPQDLASPGFQLSFGCVAGLLLFTKPLADWLVKPSPLDAPPRPWRRRARAGAVYVSANVVAFAIAMPLVAHHFGMVLPLTVALSLVALPVITATLGLGYLKVMVGLLFPSAGVLLAAPLQWCADLMVALVRTSSSWSIATVELQRPANAVWTIAALAVVAALFSGCFRGRRAAGIATVAICVFWLVALNEPAWVARLRFWQHRNTALQLNMLAVGNGSCYVVRLDPGGPDEHVLMFDCGSVAYMDVGKNTVVPALRQLGVVRIDTLIVSHADLDHFCGVLDVLDQVPAGRVLVSHQLISEAQDFTSDEPKAASMLLSGLRRRGLSPLAVERGWSAQIGGASLRMLWPPADLVAASANDTSLVLSIVTGGAPDGGVHRRVVLNADIQNAAMASLLQSGEDLSADACDLPHHGSFEKGSPQWLEAVSPHIVLQSCGRSRLRQDPWAPLVGARGVRRYITARDGMVQLSIGSNGAMSVWTFKGDDGAAMR